MPDPVQEPTALCGQEWFRRGVEIGLRAAAIIAERHQGIAPVRAEIAAQVARIAEMGGGKHD
jgi:hypothetical protein